jgi:hypothetical protein
VAGSGATTVNRTHGIDASNFRLASPARNPTVYAPIGTESEYVHVVARAPAVASVARSHMLVGPHDPFGWSHWPEVRSLIATSPRLTPTSSVAVPDKMNGPGPGNA